MARPSQLLAATTLLACAATSLASANPVRHPNAALNPAYPVLFRHFTPPRPPRPRVRITEADRARARAAGWQPVTANPLFGDNGAGTPLQMTDGTVMVDDNAGSYYRLTPDQNGSYVSGTWTQAPSLPSGYGPLYFGSAVLPDGRLIVEGGEYNFFNGVETNLGAIYDPLANSWTSVSPPSGWREIGDGSTVVLNDGTMMLGNCCSSVQALLNASNLTWAQVGNGKADPNSEEGWVLLPDGTVLTADITAQQHSERYDPTSQTWSSAGSIPVNLVAASEEGPGVLRANGTVFWAGATGHTAVYTISTGLWTAGPDFPIIGGRQLDVADGPASLLRNGNVLIPASPGVYQPPSYFFLFNGTKLIQIPGTPNAPNDPSFAFRTMVLPTGQILTTDGSDDVEIYTPGGKTLKKMFPKITSVPLQLTHGSTYQISGVNFNGISQTNFYGDDASEATNYPLVRITNGATGHVFYARTHNHSFMGVASKQTVLTMFDVPSNIELGASKLNVVANGVPSKPKAVTIQ